MQFHCSNTFDKKINFKNRTRILCCNQLDFCNENYLDKLESAKNSNEILTLAILFSSLISIFYLTWRKLINKPVKQLRFEDEAVAANEKSFYKDIILKESIGVGRYGKVFKGELNDQLVAIKIFTNNDYDSYRRELEIYKIHSLSRESILKCIGWDTLLSNINYGIEYWLILDYCQLGSLFDYLQRNILEKDQLLSIMLSAISALNHLHDTQEFTITKLGIAHRDWKSKNLLMKSPATVCIADFGLCVTTNDISQKQFIKIQQGTKRYFSPEVLNETLDVNEFESFALSDIYSFSLVFWESLNRSEFNLNCNAYRLPYYEFTNNDPSIDKMRKIVVEERRRPNFDNYENSEIQNSICSIIRNCWHANAKRRLNSFQIKQQLDELYFKIKK